MGKKQILPLASHRAGVLLFWICWLAYFVGQLGRMNYSVALTGIVDSGFLPKSTAGLIGTCFYVFYGGSQIISGWLGDHVNCYLLIAIGLTGTAAANLWMSTADGLAVMMVAWALNGVMESLLWTPIIKLFATVMPPEQRTGACVNINTTSAAGQLACYALSNWALTNYGWKQVFSVASIPIFAGAVVFVIGVHVLSRQPTVKRLPEPVEPPATDGRKHSPHGFGWLFVMSGAVFMMIPIAVQSVLREGMTTWTPTMLSETFSVGSSFAVTLTMILPVPVLIGGYLGSWVNEKFMHNEMKTSTLFFAFAFVCLLVMYFTAKVSIWCVLVMLALVVMAAYAINIMIITFVPVRLSKHGHVGMAAGVLNATAYAGGAISTYGIGWFAETEGWDSTMLLWAGLCGMAMVLCALIIPRWGRFLKKTEELTAE